MFLLVRVKRLSHDKFYPKIFATPSQLGDVTVIQVSDSQTADLQFSLSSSEVENLNLAHTINKTPDKLGISLWWSFTTKFEPNLSARAEA